MELQSMLWFFVVSLFFGKIKVLGGNFPCKKNEYRIHNGSMPCLRCNDCVHGYGLSPPCGSLLQHPPKIECFPCKEGKTYSDEHGPSSCKKCHHCSLHEIVTKHCTVETDTICSHTCEPGFYYENATHGCQQCSYCCDDENDIRIPACKSQKKQCSIHNAQKCTPVTTITTLTTPTTSPLNRTSPPVSKKDLAIKIAFSFGGVIMAIIIVVILVYYKCIKIKRRPGNPKENNLAIAENGAARQPLRCGLDDLRVKLLNYNGPDTQTKKLSDGSRLLMEVFCENENNNDCYIKKRCLFTWKKDGSILNDDEEYKLERHNITITDSGRYLCHLHCERHQQDKDSNELVIHVKPEQGKELKLFIDLEIETRQHVEKLLKPKTVDVGNWQNVGAKYEMDAVTLNSIKDEENRAEQVVDYLHSFYPNLTIFDFCEVLKTMKQFQIVKELSKHLTVEKKVQEANNISLNDTRPDSGVHSEDEYCLKVELPDVKYSQFKHVINPCYSDSSREGSREGSLDELPTTKKKALLKKTKYDNSNDNQPGGGRNRIPSFNRQPSNQSNKSTGNASINSFKNAVTYAVTKKRKNSYKEHTVDLDDTEDSEA